ncbi:MAG: DUF4345 domain-containing protein [Woeseiaceae bacterium]
MNQFFTKTTLVGSGAILAFIGVALMLFPSSFLSMNDVEIANDPNLISELIAPSGVLLVTGIFMMHASFRQSLWRFAMRIGAVVYGSYGVSRLIGIAMFGTPSRSLVQAAVLELCIAALLIFLQRRFSHDL